MKLRAREVNKNTKGTTLQMAGERLGGTAAFALCGEVGGWWNGTRARWEIRVEGGKALGESVGLRVQRDHWRVCIVLGSRRDVHRDWKPEIRKGTFGSPCTGVTPPKIK